MSLRPDIKITQTRIEICRRGDRRETRKKIEICRRGDRMETRRKIFSGTMYRIIYIMSVADIINSEYNRLTAKKTEVDNASLAQQRAIMLNEGYKKRFAKYVQLVMIFCIVLLVYLGLLSFQKSMTFIPEIVIDVFVGFLFGGALIYVISSLLDISIRNDTNFDELNLPEYSPTEVKTDAMTRLQDAVAPLALEKPTVEEKNSSPFRIRNSNEQIMGVGLDNAFTLITK